MKVYVERRDGSQRVIERTGPYTRSSTEVRGAVALQMHIAQAHNRSRYPNDDSFQLVYVVDATKE